eukprot:Tamp_06136.p1 GENE.Tamp_06136~~Tamp_06136.p1  ORF type:complete len:810 (+),score=140.67 Tamp_06136:82-2511(+)
MPLPRTRRTASARDSFPLCVEDTKLLVVKHCRSMPAAGAGRAMRVVAAVTFLNAAVAFGPTAIMPTLRTAGRVTAASFAAARTREAVARWVPAVLAPRMSAASSQAVGDKGVSAPTTPLLAQLESPTPPEPQRSVDRAGYRADASARTWPDFQYASAAERRAAADEIMQAMFERSVAEQEEAGMALPASGSATLSSLPALKVVLIGGPCSGKGSIAPLLSKVFRMRAVSVGQLLRGEVRSGTARGRQVRAAMERGELLDDSVVLELVRSRVIDSWDAQQNGWQLVGFPRSLQQARDVATDESEMGLRPDCVIVLDRPDELCKEFALGRMVDSVTGKFFHPDYAPPPADICESGRLMWRSDDTTSGIEKRISNYKSNIDDILAAFSEAGVPVKSVDNARCDLETFAEIASYLENLAREKIQQGGGWKEFYREQYGASQQGDELGDVSPLCDLKEEELQDCLDNWGTVSATDGAVAQSAYLAAVRRCNTFSPKDFVPVLIGELQVGWSSRAFLGELSPHLVKGRAVELVQLKDDKARASDVNGDKKLDIKGFDIALRLAPSQTTLEGRTQTLEALVKELVAEGVIPAKAIRRELQDVRPISVGFLGGAAGEAMPPLLKLERGAMIHFGVPSYGIHVNGFVANPDTHRPEAIWVAKRSMSKATYPGLFDQVVAGGQPAGLTFLDNCAKECEEEASLPPDVVASLTPTGLISYKYKTRKGLSTKVLATFDVRLPKDLVPVCGDGEVEDFRLWSIEEALQSIRDSLPLWKPNSALVMLDFGIRHGFISPDEPGYAEICHLLRAGLSVEDLRSRF